MEDRTAKRRGPIGWLASRSRRFQIVLAAGVVIVLPVLYGLSFGPVCWAISQKMGGIVQQNRRTVQYVYWPIGALAAKESSPLCRTLRWYVRLCTPDGRYVMVPTDHKGTMAAIFKQDTKRSSP